MLVEQMLPRAIDRLLVTDAEATVRHAAELMSIPHTDLVIVCERGDMVGVVTKTDIVGHISRCLGSGCSARVDSIMTRDVAFCRVGDMLHNVWRMMNDRGIQRVPVLDLERKPIGIIYARDALQHLLTSSENEDGLLRDYISGVGYH